jgi:hypothetical protein
MALYMVKARPRKELLENLQKDLSSGKISRLFESEVDSEGNVTQKTWEWK